MRRYTAAIGMLFVLVCPFVAIAQPIVVCGGSQGMAYYLQRPGSRLGSEWQKDGMSQGFIALRRVGSAFDIDVVDSVGPQSLSVNGAKLSLVAQNEDGGTFTILATYPTHLEHFTFRLERGGGEVVWGIVRPGETTPKVSIYVAKCQRG